jgi:hypothetical protein
VQPLPPTPPPPQPPQPPLPPLSSLSRACNLKKIVSVWDKTNGAPGRKPEPWFRSGCPFLLLTASRHSFYTRSLGPLISKITEHGPVLCIIFFIFIICLIATIYRLYIAKYINLYLCLVNVNVGGVEDQANNTRQCKTERCIEQER